MRSQSVSTVSLGSTSTAFCARIGPSSRTSVATWTVQPVTFTPARMASKTTWFPLNMGRSAGCVLRILPLKPRSKITRCRIVMKPAIATKSIWQPIRICKIRRVYTSLSASNLLGLKSVRFTNSVSIPAARAISNPRHGRSASTSTIPSSSFCGIIASSNEPVPETKIATLFGIPIGSPFH